MYQLQYADIEEDAIVDAKTREREILQRSVNLLIAARDERPNGRQIVEATHFVHRVWTAFLNDLANPDNQLPNELRASLISIGIWVLKENDQIRVGDSEDFDGVIEISKTIMKGI